MVSKTRPRESELPPQLRPMDPARDLGEVARVIEIAFADELSPGGHIIMREMRMLTSLGPLLRVFSRAMPSLLDVFGGYVWEVEGRVVGNITLTRADGTNAQWIISNVGVLPDFRRQGIARTMMQTVLEQLRHRGASRALLHVHHENQGAKALYESLGFRYLETITEMVSDTIRPTSLPVPPDVIVRAPDAKRWYEAYEVARAALPRAIQEMRPLRAQGFQIRERSALERLRDALLGPPRERWWAEVGGQVAGLLTIDRQMSRQGDQVELMVHPKREGTVEGALVNHLSARLSGHRESRTAVAAHLTEARAALRVAGFYELRTLDHMALEL